MQCCDMSYGRKTILSLSNTQTDYKFKNVNISSIRTAHSDWKYLQNIPVNIWIEPFIDAPFVRFGQFEQVS